MKKMVFMAAFVAATAAFVACSSNDDLVQQKPDVPEEMVDEGVPMKIIVSDLATRGTDFSSTNPLTKFKLYSSLDSYWTAGKLMEYKNDAWTTNNSLTWDDEDEHTFFAINVEEDDEFADIAENAGAGDDHPDLPVVTATTCSFNYKMPISVKPKADPDDPDEYYYNSENLKDLLVAKSTGGAQYEPVYNDPVNGETKYEAGSLFVNFQHALAQITAIKVYANTTKLIAKGINDYDKYRFRIDKIRLGGLKTIGTYTFDESTPWVVSGTAEEFEVPLDIPADPGEAFTQMSFTPDPLNTKHSLPLTDGGLYIIPQAVTGKVKKDNGSYIIDGAYAELDAQVFFYDSGDSGWFHCCEDNSPMDFTQSDSETAKFGKIRIPLIFDIESGSGKSYTLVLDLGQGIITEDPMFTGEAIFEGANFDVGG